MTWSSDRENEPSSVASKDASAPQWDWAELEPGELVTGLEGHAEETLAERHSEEVAEAYRRGLADGEAAAIGGARDELASALKATLDALEEVRANREAWASTLRENLVLLAAAMARQIVDRALADDPSIFSDMAKRALASFPADEPVRIRLHPADLNRLELGEGGVDQVVGQRSVRWMPDEDMTEGGCIVEGPDKIVDGRLDEALVRLARTLTNA